MTIVDQDISKLGAALDNTSRTLLLLSGAEGSSALAIHDKAEEILEPWQRVFWIQDLSQLKQSERDAWFAMGGRYAVVARNTREVVKRGAHGDLLLATGKPSSTKIADALNEGDL